MPVSNENLRYFSEIRRYLGENKEKTITLSVDADNLPEGKPEIMEMQCGCGGVLAYGSYKFESSLNGERFSLPSVNYYHCGSCEHSLFLLEVSDEINKRVYAARKKVVESGILS